MSANESLGQRTSDVPSQIIKLKAMKTNSYEFKKKTYEQDTTFENYSQFFELQCGLVTVKAKSRQHNDGINRTPFICQCVCGNDCVVKFNQIKKLKSDLYISCSICASEIQNVIGINLVFGTSKEKFNKIWKNYLSFSGVISTDIEFYPVYKEWIDMKRADPSLVLSENIIQIANRHASKSK